MMLYRNRFFTLFPPPRFLEMRAVGIDISDRSIRFAELSRKGRELALHTFGEKFIPAGIVVQGEIRKPENLRDVLADLARQYGFSFVRISLPEQLGYSLKIKIPQVDIRDVYDSVELQLSEHVPLSPHEAVFDYDLVSCEMHGIEEGVYEIGLSVMPQKIIQSYVNLFEGTELMPLSFEFEAHAIARSVVRAGDCNTFVVLDIGATRTGFAVVSHGVIVFTSTINVGGYALTESVSRALQVSFKEGEQLKEKHGLLRGSGDQVYQALIPQLSVLRDEILKQHNYVQVKEREIRASAEEKSGTLERVILCGGEANVPGLSSYLASALEAEIEIANPWVNINSLTSYVPEITSKHALRYATALGLALKGYL